MEAGFLVRYLDAFKRIEGWFSYDAALLFMAFNTILARESPRGDTLEIGVHRGLSSIAVAALRGEGKRFTAIDLFEELQHENISRSGSGNREMFLDNLRSFYEGIDFLQLIAKPSRDVTATELGKGYTFCNIDGGHSRAETYSDISLCHEISAPGGLIAIDDYFNPLFPGVCEGVGDFMRSGGGALTPVAIGFGKVLFQKAPHTNPAETFRQLFPRVETIPVTMWDRETTLFDRPLREFFDLQASTPGELAPHGARGWATIEPQPSILSASAGATLSIPVAVTNESINTFPAGEKVFGLSYHLLSESGRELVHDNDRVWLTEPLKPGERRLFEMPVRAPSDSGRYLIEIDLVWEGVTWCKELGITTPYVSLTVN